MNILIMLGPLLGLALGGVLVFFAYRQGISDGQKVQDKVQVVQPKPIKHEEPTVDLFAEGIQNIMNYNGKKKE